jgi:hypothetical protein
MDTTIEPNKFAGDHERNRSNKQSGNLIEECSDFVSLALIKINEIDLSTRDLDRLMYAILLI